VVALLKAKEHRQSKLNKKTQKYDIPYTYHHWHMAIVLGGKTSTTGYPYVMSGSEDSYGQSDGKKAVDNVWRKIDAGNVKYYRTTKTFIKLTPN